MKNKNTQGVTVTGALVVGNGPSAGGRMAVGASPVQINGIFNSTSTALAIASVTAASSNETSVTVTGARVGDIVVASPQAAIQAGLTWCAYVSANDTVKLRVANDTAGNLTPTAVNWNFLLIRLT